MFEEIWRSVADSLGVGVFPLELNAAEVALRAALILPSTRLSASRTAISPVPG
jgi:hypothetical protein